MSISRNVHRVLRTRKAAIHRIEEIEEVEIIEEGLAEAELLGVLGNRRHYRCRNTGLTFSRPNIQDQEHFT